MVGVEWGDEYHELVLGPEGRSRVKTGQPLELEGEGRHRNGEYSQNT